MFRHRFDPSACVAAIIFLGVAVRYLAAGLGHSTIAPMWIVPGVLVALGLVWTLRLVFRSRRREP